MKAGRRGNCTRHRERGIRESSHEIPPAITLAIIGILILIFLFSGGNIRKILGRDDLPNAVHSELETEATSDHVEYKSNYPDMEFPA